MAAARPECLELPLWAGEEPPGFEVNNFYAFVGRGVFNLLDAGGGILQLHSADCETSQGVECPCRPQLILISRAP